LLQDYGAFSLYDPMVKTGKQRFAIWREFVYYGVIFTRKSGHPTKLHALSVQTRLVSNTLILNVSSRNQ
jgi:hypothetical protein